MTKQDMLKLKIEIAIRSAQVNAMLYMRNEATWSETEKKAIIMINELYEAIAHMEPAHESEVV